MAQNRRKARSEKQRRHKKALANQNGNNPSGKASAQGTDVAVTSAPKSSPKAKKSSKQRYAPNPINREGVLNWHSVAVPRVTQLKDNPSLPQATMQDQESAGLCWLFIIVTFFGIIFSTQWSPLLLSLLVGAALLDKRMREDNQVVWQAALAALLSIACWPLIMQVTSISSLSLNTTAVITLAVFSAALWLVGVTCRRASLLNTRLFAQLGLYSAGIACQALSLLVVFLGAISLGILVF